MFQFPTNLLIICVAFILLLSNATAKIKPKVQFTCRSAVYCEGPLLHVVQTAHIFNDSKTFVDMSMKNSVNETLANFDLMMRKTSMKPTKQDIKKFVYDNFEAVTGLENASPRDFNPDPRILKEIPDKEIRDFTKSVIAIWPQLTKRTRPQVSQNPERQSLIPVKNSVVVPGGRFVQQKKMKLLGLAIIFFFAIQNLEISEANKRESCSSPIYCQGDLLNLVQMSGIFNDSKTFVDMSLVFDQNETLTNFDMFMRQVDQNPTKAQIQEFVSKHFKTVGEMEDYYPMDYNPEPRIVKEIPDKKIREFTKALIALWPQLTRKVSHHVIEKPETYSLIPVKNAFIIPGGRFKEYYYWDSYWIVKGLLLSDMKDTARGMVENLLSMVERYGFVPNGGRIYYLNRSQPPVLTLMMADYVHYTRDFEFLKENIKTLEKELDFWLKKRTTKVEKDGEAYYLAHFDSESDTPRPESYLEDIITCAEHDTDEERHECYIELKSGAESGWDFTSRWIFDENGEPTGSLQYIKTRRNIPVDLNCFLFRSFMDLSKFYAILRDPQRAKYWYDMAEKWKYNIEKVFYDHEDGMWYDYDVKLQKSRKYFAASNFTPLWVGAVDSNEKANRGKSAAHYLKKHGILSLHGIPSTSLPSGQQWDFPNAWSPYQNIIIIGLQRSGDEEAQEVAKELANKWVKSNIKAFNENKVMFEKYNAKNSGQFGGGGEYHIQSGFGWTNGSIMELIDSFFRVKTRKTRSLEAY